MNLITIKLQIKFQKLKIIVILNEINKLSILFIISIFSLKNEHKFLFIESVNLYIITEHDYCKL